MRRYFCLSVLFAALPLVANAVETKVHSNLSGSMSALRLQNQTIFAQTTTISLSGQVVDTFNLEAHEAKEIYLECHGSVQEDNVAVTVKTESNQWDGPVPMARTVKRPVLLWISHQRQGRAHIEKLVRDVRPSAVVKHLALAEVPKSIPQYDEISMVMVSSADLERIDDEGFETLRNAVSMGMVLTVSAREAGAESRARLAALTSARFSKWSPVESGLSDKLPSATRIANVVVGNTSVAVFKEEETVLIADSPFGFGQLRLVGVPLAALSKGEVSTAVFSPPSSRVAQPIRWLETRTSSRLESFFISPLIPLSGAILLLGVYLSKRRKLFLTAWAIAWLASMLSVAVTQNGLVLVKQWGLWSKSGLGQALVSRLDVDHRLGEHQIFDLSASGLDFMSLRAGSVCLVHRDSRTRLVFPSTPERMTRLFIVRPVVGKTDQLQTVSSKSLPRWPSGPFSGAALMPVKVPNELDECKNRDCEIYRISANP